MIESTRSNGDFELESVQSEPDMQNKSDDTLIDSEYQTVNCNIPLLIMISCVMSIIPLIKLIIGIVHYDDCIIRITIGSYMIVSGVVEIIMSFIFIPV